MRMTAMRRSTTQTMSTNLHDHEHLRQRRRGDRRLRCRGQGAGLWGLVRLATQGMSTDQVDTLFKTTTR